MPTLPTTDPGPAFATFVAEHHLAVLTLVRSNGRPHSTPVGFTWDADHSRARVITWSGSLKVSLLAAGPLEGSICQVDGGRKGQSSVSAPVVGGGTDWWTRLRVLRRRCANSVQDEVVWIQHELLAGSSIELVVSPRSVIKWNRRGIDGLRDLAPIIQDGGH